MLPFVALGVRAEPWAAWDEFVGGRLVQAGQRCDNVGDEAEAAVGGVLADPNRHGHRGVVGHGNLGVLRDWRRSAPMKQAAAPRRRAPPDWRHRHCRHLHRRAQVEIDAAGLDWTWLSRPPPVAVEVTRYTGSILIFIPPSFSVVHRFGAWTL